MKEDSKLRKNDVSTNSLHKSSLYDYSLSASGYW